MEDLIRSAVSYKKVQKMKNPRVLMNSKDFELFVKEVESKASGLITGDNPSYNGIPIIAKEYFEKDKFIIYDMQVDKIGSLKAQKQ